MSAQTLFEKLLFLFHWIRPNAFAPIPIRVRSLREADEARFRER
jgi:hypothetical protein